MVDEAKVEDIRREFEELVARMQQPDQTEAMRLLMSMSEETVRRSLHAYYDSPAGKSRLGRSPEFLARAAIARGVAEETMEDEAAADVWLVTPVLSLGGVTPLSRLHSDEGLKEVLRVLASIEHGLPP